MADLLEELLPETPDAAVSAADAACRAGATAGSVGAAFLAGYRAALRALVPGMDADASMCATEAQGAHPRSIGTRLSRHGSGFRVSGEKRWVTGATDASLLLVLASEGVGEDGRNRLRCVCIDPRTSGVRIEAMPAPSFTPEIVHAFVTLTDVAVTAGDILPGDGYTRYLKPFRTVEDIHVLTALLGYLVSVASRWQWPQEALEDLLTMLVALRALAGGDPLSPRTHLALAGTQRWIAERIESFEPHWSLVDEAVRDAWRRDRELLTVAQRARDQRRAAAWKTLARDSR